ncbi:multiheme c-type cytochrome [Tenacibaculum tangerinum]|uniref:Multiheme c-type cytochrome n=1 Tax=Tenacibaculum tangerinum TaxID=3038772 RepID=A0ABY8L5R9_9FLAO|nr:multiheme c-type cytochrome [Tenacibaculum tangerinum]WGH76766.1 multiheme c-type cytochrome [Tenacibaculum tangerinum]
MRKRLGIISLFIILFISFITVWNYSYQTGKEEAYVPVENSKEYFTIPSESEVFKRSKYALDYSNMPVDENHQRSMKTYYKNRAFYGAPPSIPHVVEEKQTIGDASCLQCHENGGFVEKFKAYTPVTPHPELVNCKQCHVAQKEQTLFKTGNFSVVTGPEVGVNNALVSSPPVIPHHIQLRENCLACHAGPSAPKEIRVTHPERVNCRQCHVLNTKATVDNMQDFMRKIEN